MAIANEKSLQLETTGATDYVSISHASQTGLSFTGSFSLSFWWMLGSDSPGSSVAMPLISKYDNSVGGYELQYFNTGSGTQLRLLLREDGSTVDTLSINVSTYPEAVSQTVFVHIAVTVDYSGGTPSVKWYRNGALIETDTGSTTEIGENEAEFAIGMRSGGTETASIVNFDGQIDEVKVWNSVLTESLVRSYMRENIVQTSLKGYWDFNNDLSDSSGNGNSLSVAGGSPVFSATIPFLRYGRTQRYYVGSGDGNVEARGANFSTQRDLATGTSVDVSGTTAEAQVLKEGFSSTHEIDRLFLPIDTSGQGSAPTIIDAYLGLFVDTATSTGQNNPGTAEVCLVQTTQASNSTLTTADYDQCGDLNSPEEGMTRLSLEDDISATDINYWALNSVGRGWINVSGTTKLGVRISLDVDNDAPSGNPIWTDQLVIRTSETSDSDDRPHLDIVDTYTPPDILDGASDATPGTGGEDREDEGGSGVIPPSGDEGSWGTIPSGGGDGPGGASDAGTVALVAGMMILD